MSKKKYTKSEFKKFVYAVFNILDLPVEWRGKPFEYHGATATMFCTNNYNDETKISNTYNRGVWLIHPSERQSNGFYNWLVVLKENGILSDERDVMSFDGDEQAFVDWFMTVRLAEDINARAYGWALDIIAKVSGK